MDQTANGWDVYYVVFLSAVLALGIPAVLKLISYIFVSRSGAARNPGSPSLQVTTPLSVAQLDPRHDSQELGGRRVNTRFFLGANAALTLVALSLLLAPNVVSVQHDRGLIAIVTLSSFAALGLFYSARKGDLHWLRSFRGMDEHDEK